MRYKILQQVRNREFTHDWLPVGVEVQLFEEDSEPSSQPGFQAGFSFGTWMPTGSLKQLGTHPQIGLMAGGNGRRTFFGIDPRNQQECEEKMSGMINSLNIDTGIRYQRKFQENRFFSIIIR